MTAGTSKMPGLRRSRCARRHTLQWRLQRDGPAPRISQEDYERKQEYEMIMDRIRHEFLTHRQAPDENPYLFYEKKLRLLNYLRDDVTGQQLTEHEILDFIWPLFSEDVQDYLAKEYITDRESMRGYLFIYSIEEWKKPIDDSPRCSNPQLPYPESTSVPEHDAPPQVRIDQDVEVTMEFPKIQSRNFTDWPFSKFPSVLIDEVVQIGKLFYEKGVIESTTEVDAPIETRSTDVGESTEKVHNENNTETIQHVISNQAVDNIKVVEIAFAEDKNKSCASNENIAGENELQPNEPPDVGDIDILPVNDFQKMESRADEPMPSPPVECCTRRTPPSAIRKSAVWYKWKKIKLKTPMPKEFRTRSKWTKARKKPQRRTPSHTLRRMLPPGDQPRLPVEPYMPASANTLWIQRCQLRILVSQLPGRPPGCSTRLPACIKTES